jgi:uncharacterized protein YutE (UPF0331/DUF86 family)
MSMLEQEAAVLDNVLSRYKAEGFDVYLNPSPSILPPFMHAHRPDAIARRQDKNIAIEFVRSGERAERKIKEFQSLLAPHRDWELRIVYVSRGETDKLETVSRTAAESAIQRVRDLRRDGHILPALIMAWAVLEAIGRALLPARISRPQTPSRLLEVLASDGHITPDEADVLRRTIPLRNAAVHGEIDREVDENLLERFVAILDTLAGMLSEESE